MKLAGLLINNYRRIGTTGCEIRIDEIVVLIGCNNVGKSTVLDAYEAFASGGRELEATHFNSATPNEPVAITGVFNSLTTEDTDVLGQKWIHTHPTYGDCIRVRWVWEKPGAKGQKQSFDPTIQQFVDGGVGGWDSLVLSRIPVPVRIRPTDSPELTQNRVVGMLRDHVKKKLKADSTTTQAIFAKIEELSQKLYEESKETFDDVAARITSSIGRVFEGASVSVVPRSKDAIDEKMIAADSYLRVTTIAGGTSPLSLQGTGLQRALLWSALSVMSESNSDKKKSKTSGEVGRILLIDEPEAFLHPPTIRSARESLYEFALENTDWQVIATTHSPVFIDLSKSHTTIIRVDPTCPTAHYLSTDQVSFNVDERTRLQMIRACNPMVNEFFFYDNIVLVEGPTEHIVLRHVAKNVGLDVHIIECMGKANIPLFARILNHFKIPYTVIHDSDTPKCRRKGKLVNNGMWTLNDTIRNAVSESSGACIFTQFSNFETAFFGEELANGKVDAVLEVLADANSAEYKAISETYEAVLKREVGIMTTSVADFQAKQIAFVDAKDLAMDPLWMAEPADATAAPA